MSRIVVGGVGLNTRRLGEGPDVVLVHGLAANMAFWRVPAMRLLSERFRVTLYDQRGHGYSDTPATGYGEADLAGDLAGLLDALGVGSAHLVGHSHGGAAVLRYALDHPGRVRSLTIADTRIPSLQPTLSKSEFPHWEQWRERFREAGFDVEDEQDIDFEILEAFDDPRWRDLRRSLGGAKVFVPFEGLNGGQRGIRRWRDLLQTTSARAEFRAYRGPEPADLMALGVPTLAYYGQFSHCLASGRAFADHVPGCRREICPQAGHFFPFVHPHPFAETVARFIDDAEAAARRPVARPAAAGLRPVGATASAASPAEPGHSIAASGEEK